LEKVLAHEAIFTLFLEYYPRPHEAKAQLAFFKKLWSKFNLVKGSQSNNKLAHKDSLLEASINIDVSRVPSFRFKSLSRLLGTKKSNLYHALVRR
jgi:hypothetical protein